MAYGTVNADLVSTSTPGGVLGAGNATGFKNRIINGAMVIDQRNAGASVTPASGTDTFTVDRFSIYASQSSKLTAQQNAGSVTPPAGFTNYLGITSSSSYSITTSDWFTLRQPIEGFNMADLGWGTANAKTVTLSFQVYSSLTGTFGGSLRNNAGNRSYPFTYAISSANTWTQISVTIAGDTSGTWATNNAIGVSVFWGLGVGSSNSGTAGAWASASYGSATGATSVVGTNGATFYITGVQLEVGSTASSFDVRDYGRELMLCQRYYWQRNNETTFAGLGSGVMNQATVARICFNYPVPMRTTPTISFTSIGSFLVAQGVPDVTPSGATPYANSTGAMVDITTGTGTQGRGAVLIFNGGVSTGSMQASAEL